MFRRFASWFPVRRRRVAFQALCLLTLLALAPSAWVYAEAAGRLRTVADAPSAPVAVVFGAGLDPVSGAPSPYLKGRLDAALALYREGRVRALLVTGDNSRTDYDEPDAMRDYLVRNGVPARLVVRDYAGFDTWDSCARAHRIFGVDRAVLVSQEFHIRRAVTLCQAAGIESWGVGVPGPHDATWVYGVVREVGAAGKAALDTAFHPDPHFLGPRETSLQAVAGTR
ncbi:SanA/YdcF family protein [Streptacidiphilus monticola]|uniref:Vancomycin high temperature exclusion protein n=1 Tax=Streptacidiphilus monticola TaxID=2161674 RepID=A0ABW1G248_9ACTN